MGLVPAKCTSCCGTLEVDAELKAAICPHCGSAYIVQEAINQYNVTNVYQINKASLKVDHRQLFADRIEAANYDSEYNEYYPGPHWQFATPADPIDLTEEYNAKECTLVTLPFPHNSSELEYDEESGKYLYYEYGMAHIDPENDDAQLSFTNVILQCADVTQYDSNGYMQFNILNETGSGYYITGGQAIPITWEKGMDTDPTKFYNSDGEEITLNTGKTYIGLVSINRWNELVLK